MSCKLAAGLDGPTRAALLSIPAPEAPFLNGSSRACVRLALGDLALLPDLLSGGPAPLVLRCARRAPRRTRFHGSSRRPAPATWPRPRCCSTRPRPTTPRAPWRSPWSRSRSAALARVREQFDEGLISLSERDTVVAEIADLARALGRSAPRSAPRSKRCIAESRWPRGARPARARAAAPARPHGSLRRAALRSAIRGSPARSRPPARSREAWRRTPRAGRRWPRWMVLVPICERLTTRARPRCWGGCLAEDPAQEQPRRDAGEHDARDPHPVVPVLRRVGSEPRIRIRRRVGRRVRGGSRVRIRHGPRWCLREESVACWRRACAGAPGCAGAGAAGCAGCCAPATAEGEHQRGAEQ